MPWVTINLYEGRTKEIKKKLHKDVARAVAENLQIPIEKVHVHLVEMTKENHTLGGEPT